MTTEKEKPSHPLRERVAPTVKALSAFIGGRVFSENCLDGNGRPDAIIYYFGENKQNSILFWGLSGEIMVLRLGREPVHRLDRFKEAGLGENQGFTITDQKDKKALLWYNGDGKLTLKIKNYRGNN